MLVKALVKSARVLGGVAENEKYLESTYVRHRAFGNFPDRIGDFGGFIELVEDILGVGSGESLCAVFRPGGSFPEPHVGFSFVRIFCGGDGEPREGRAWPTAGRREARPLGRLSGTVLVVEQSKEPSRVEGRVCLLQPSRERVEGRSLE